MIKLQKHHLAKNTFKIKIINSKYIDLKFKDITFKSILNTYQTDRIKFISKQIIAEFSTANITTLKIKKITFTRTLKILYL